MTTHPPTSIPTTDMTTLRHQCPAFEKGCPYATLGATTRSNGNGTASPIVEAVKQCPAFQKGCPFDGVTAEQLKEVMKKIPADDVHRHALQEPTTMKHVCRDGEPLIKALQSYRSDLFFQTEAVQDSYLAKSLKDGTHEAHRKAERSKFVIEFMKGNVSRAVFAQFTASLYLVYQTLESELDRHKDHCHIHPIRFASELDRTASLARDLAYFYGEEAWQQRIHPPTPATQAYTRRLREVSATNASLLVAHAYTRYLGDLSGGQMLARRARKALDLPEDGRGTRFYMFEAIEDVKAFKDVYRHRLDTLRMDDALKDAIVEEANRALS